MVFLWCKFTEFCTVYIQDRNINVRELVHPILWRNESSPTLLVYGAAGMAGVETRGRDIDVYYRQNTVIHRPACSKKCGRMIAYAVLPIESNTR